MVVNIKILFSIFFLFNFFKLGNIYSNTTEAEKNLITLKNEKIVLGVWPESGGRIVVYRFNEGRNILLADSKQWSQQVAEPNKNSHFKPYYGHNIWLGPQSDWWSQQDVNQDRLKRKAVWPPDPYIVMGNYDVIEKTKNRIVLRSPISPISGVQLTKTYTLGGGSKVYHDYELVNRSNKIKKWDIWTMTRVPGRQFGYCYIGKGKQSLMTDGGSLPICTLDGFVYFDYLLKNIFKNPANKIFVTPESHLFQATFNHSTCFVKTSAKVPREEIHPNHASCEIYQMPERDQVFNSEPQLELEFHSSYKVLKVGESLSFQEEWKLLPYRGDMNPKAHVQFLKQHMD